MRVRRREVHVLLRPMHGAVAAESYRVSVLGKGPNGPWENRKLQIEILHPNPAAVDGWLNDTYSVQLFNHPTHPGVDHLLIRRHDDGIDIPWWHLQGIKDRLAPDGNKRWAIEVFPPAAGVVDNCNVRHIWVMPLEYSPPVDLHDVRV